MMLNYQVEIVYSCKDGNVTLRYKKLMDTKPLHSTYEVVKPFDEYKDGKYAEFSVDVEMNNEFIGRVLQMGAGLEVMSPPEVRKEFIERVRNLASHYIKLEEKH